MKKYVKPDLYFESFQLTQHIAACRYDMIGLRDVNDCYSHGDRNQDVGGYYDPTTKFFSGGQCEITPEDYCYTNASSDEIAVTIVS